METKEAAVRANVVDREVSRNDTALHKASAEELARRTKQGCRASFAELVRRYAPRLQAFLCQRTRDHHDAEDLVQETFVKAYQNIERYQESYKFSTWLFAIGTRLAISHHRKMRVRMSFSRSAYRRPVSAEATTEPEQHEDLWLLARGLSENQYRALWLKYSEELSVKEIARAMHRSQVSVKVLLYRARTNLLKKWKEEHGAQAETTTEDKKPPVTTESRGE
jgi:RNA polymerase sigma-70 factor (ECF subfamily)